MSLYYKLEALSKDEIEKIVKISGASGEIPTNLRIAKFDNRTRLGDLGFWSPSAVEYRQFNHEGKYYSGHLFHFHRGTGVAYLWNGEHNWYEFGCDHKMEHTANLGNCYNQYTCKICGFTENIDSSD